MRRKFSRREFLTGTAAGIGVCGIGHLVLGEAIAEPAKSRVVVVRGPTVFVDADSNPNTPSKLGMTHIGEADNSVDQIVLNQMVNEGVKAFAQRPTPEAAWKRFFRPTDVVGIKVNTFGGKPVSVRPEMVAAVIAGLKLAGVQEDNIVVWDRANHELIAAGFKVNIDGPGVKVKGTQPDGYESEPVELETFNGRFSKILTREVTALINLPCVKHTGGPKITCAMKNHYGSIDNPGDHHAANGNCDPYLADLYRVPLIQEKTRLIIVEALKPLCDKGPGRCAETPELQWPEKAIMVGLDPVAIDHLGLKMIDARRKELGLETLYTETSPRYLYSAVARGVGTNDPNRIEVIGRTVG